MPVMFKSLYGGKLFVHICKLEWLKSKHIWVNKNVFICSPLGPHRAENSDRDFAHSHNLYNLHFDVRYKNTVFAGCRVHQTDRTGENTVFFQCF